MNTEEGRRALKWLNEHGEDLLRIADVAFEANISVPKASSRLKQQGDAHIGTLIAEEIKDQLRKHESLLLHQPMLDIIASIALSVLRREGLVDD